MDIEFVDWQYIAILIYCPSTMGDGASRLVWMN